MSGISLSEAEAAQRLLEDPDLQQAIEELKADVFEKWLATEEGDAEGREILWHRVQAAGDLMETLKRKVDAHRVAARRGERNK
ncbi:hypothetical protein [Maricaulis sp.]|jgi:hypothetical protein|uniref:hypothetical protein n=1 Tax=Maricaulis sp. TaxID=1486257 RepID=UPI002627FE3A|nr:hypothetical protein [Maricaulis sp.]MDF1769841.1 hypothetical protein [Maricaulis sp.]